MRHYWSELPSATLSALIRRRWAWFLLFIVVASLLLVLATGWNLVLVQDYQRMLELARQLTQSRQVGETPAPWASLILGTMGFIAAFGMLMIFFFRLLQEMRLNQLQSEFLATMSHELKSPIASIELSSSLIRSGGLTEAETELLWASHAAELKRLREQVEAVLEAARWQADLAGRKERAEELATIPLEDWLNTSMERWRAILGPGAEIERAGDPIVTAIPGDLRILNLVSDNLMDNARKFARGAPKVTICTRWLPPRVPGWRPRWQIEFRDQGLGFDPADSSRIFDRFFRGQHRVARAIPGTGLGLHLARTASRSLGMTLKATSEGVGRGATFLLQGTQRSVPGNAAAG